MVSAILHAAMGMMGLFAFLVFIALSVVALVPILGSIYYLIADLYKWIKSKLDQAVVLSRFVGKNTFKLFLKKMLTKRKISVIIST